MRVIDNFLSAREHAMIRDYLAHVGGWKFGWKSHSSTDNFSFWHKHFAGHKKTTPDRGRGQAGEEREKPYPCADELLKTASLMHAFWKHLEDTVLKGHTLYRCYANGQTYGSDGTLHTDSKSPNASTLIYYPAETWEPNWAGETVLFNADKSDILASIYPKPNRLVIFPGNTPHVARGVSRTCPVLRVVLVFKSEGPDVSGAVQELPARPGESGPPAP